MIIVIAFLILGFVIGLIFRRLEQYKRPIGFLYISTVVVLLFSMGVTLGANQELLANLPNIGLKAITFTVCTVLGTMIMTYLVIRQRLLPSK